MKTVKETASQECRQNCVKLFLDGLCADNGLYLTHRRKSQPLVACDVWSSRPTGGGGVSCDAVRCRSWWCADVRDAPAQCDWKKEVGTLLAEWKEEEEE